ncbi:phosphoribosylamine--glycine ligase [Elongatibacter sediminis]|uniref:Phosphoribosylamine--glycine ligase n=1 Tax=Elongatibacter sediminis TaxID=3119006 RepID=A0AAW9RDT6_9GAMM
MKILIVGGGGREHALAWKAARCRGVTQVFAAPGNAGTAGEAGVENVAISASDIDGLAEFAKERGIDLTIVGPEDPLAGGIVDRFTAAGLRCFGPSAAAARLEGSKAFAKDFMARHGIPTAAYGEFTDVSEAIDFIRKHGAPIVIKADGLAAGKGVVVAHNLAQAEAAVFDMLAGNVYGEAGHRIIVEEFLEGEEASFIVMADGRHILPLATSQDHKAVGDRDTGPNTGGMGAYSPAPVIDGALHEQVMDTVIRPTVDGMAAEGHPFTGFLYAGLMIGADGSARVLEFNVRFGDPETQPVLMRLRSDLVEHCRAALEGRLDQERADWDPRPSLGVVLAAEGYPGKYRKGEVITGLGEAGDDSVKIFHAGTALDDQGQVVTSGGRVLCVCALGETVAAAQKTAYAACESIHWPGVFHRTDIGYRAIAREQR